MGKTAFLFPGQGSQSVGMLASLAAEFPVVTETFAQASEVLGYELWDICQNGPEEKLNHTETTQPAMLAAGIATWRVWDESGGPVPQLMAGHSLGEYSALVVADVMSFADAITIVALRGRAMQEATPEGIGAMAAILGLNDDILSGICTEQALGEVVSCANYNSPGQVVIAGHRQAVERVCEAAAAAGARRTIILPVSVPSHCALMKPAAETLKEALSNVKLQVGRIPVIQNVDVQAYKNPVDVASALTRQLWQPVRWNETIQHLSSLGVENFVECGPGKVLAGLNRRISRASEITALIDPAAVNALLDRNQMEYVS